MIRYGAFLRIKVPTGTKKHEFKYCQECYPNKPPAYTMIGKYCQAHGCQLVTNEVDVTFSDSNSLYAMMKPWDSSALDCFHRYENGSKYIYVYMKHENSSATVDYESIRTDIDKTDAFVLLEDAVSSFIQPLLENYDDVSLVFGVVGDDENDAARDN